MQIQFINFLLYIIVQCIVAYACTVGIVCCAKQFSTGYFTLLYCTVLVPYCTLHCILHGVLVQYFTAVNAAALYYILQYCTEKYNFVYTAPCDKRTIFCELLLIRYYTIQYTSVHNNIIQYRIVQYSTISHNAVQCSTM